MSKKTDLQIKLEEQFQSLLPEADAPREVEKEVFRTLDFLEIAGEVVDLFTDKLGKTAARAIDAIDNDSKEDN